MGLVLTATKSCKKDKKDEDITATITDIDGNVYASVAIGTQVWLTENLKTTKYNDGAQITRVIDPVIWSNLTTHSYCWYNNDLNNKDAYGALYNWYTVNTGNLCPTGWHVPTDAEWTILTTLLGQSDAASRLKEQGLTHWQSPNPPGLNVTGFLALPGGRRSDNGDFIQITFIGSWWSSTETGSGGAISRQIYWDLPNASTIAGDKRAGYSVRCLKN